MASHHPQEIRLQQNTRILHVSFSDGSRFELPCEYLRVFSPSAEVRGHTGGLLNLVTGKQSVNIKEIKPIGRYAIKIFFDDGHKSGLYDWDFLYELGTKQDENWAYYQERCAQAKQ